MLKSLLKFDWLLVISMVTLVTIGTLMVYSTTVGDANQTGFMIRQIAYLVVGLLLFFSVSFINFRVLVNLSLWMYVVVLTLLIITFILGIETRGSTRWIDLKFFTLQASEIAKPVMILFLAYFFNKYSAIRLRSLVISFGLILLPALLIFRQPDLGSAVVVILIWVLLVYLSGIKTKYIIALFLLIIVAFPIGANFLKPYQKERILTFMNPTADPLGTGYNLVQSIIAVGSGQDFGRGFGRGTQSHLNFLPEQKTDFIFATTAEELGFFGIGLILILFLVLTIRIFRIASWSGSKTGALICYGAGGVIIIQLFVNAGMNMGLLPITGITLPFISFGGSSLISMMIMVGLVQSVHLHRKDPLDLLRK